VKKNRANVKNILQVEDLDMAQDPTNHFGMSFKRIAREVKRSDDTAQLKMDFQKNRWWRLTAIDKTTGKDLGGIAIRSASIGPSPPDWQQAPTRWKQDTEHQKFNTFENHWWMYNQDLFLQKASNMRNKQLLLSDAEKDNYSCWVGKAERCLPVEEIGEDDTPAVHAIMKVYHAVITDELPVQDGFTNVQIDITPHNLFEWNPNVLTRYMPGYAERFQNNWFHEGEKVYTPPYASEWAELGSGRKKDEL